jgi:hypothetical protein
MTTPEKVKPKRKKRWTKDRKYYDYADEPFLRCGKCDKPVEVTTLGGGVFFIEHHARCVKEGDE